MEGRGGVFNYGRRRRKGSRLSSIGKGLAEVTNGGGRMGELLTPHQVSCQTVWGPGRRGSGAVPHLWIPYRRLVLFELAMFRDVENRHCFPDFRVFFVNFSFPIPSHPTPGHPDRDQGPLPKLKNISKPRPKNISHPTHHSHTPQWGNPCCHAKKEKATYNRPLNRGGRPSGFPFGTAPRRHRRAFLHHTSLAATSARMRALHSLHVFTITTVDKESWEWSACSGRAKIKDPSPPTKCSRTRHSKKYCIAPSTRHPALLNPMQSLRSDSDDAKNAAEIDTSKSISEPSHRNACSLGM